MPYLEAGEDILLLLVSSHNVQNVRVSRLRGRKRLPASVSRRRMCRQKAPA